MTPDRAALRALAEMRPGELFDAITVLELIDALDAAEARVAEREKHFDFHFNEALKAGLETAGELHARIAELESFVQFHRAKVTGLNERIAGLEATQATLLRGLQRVVGEPWRAGKRTKDLLAADPPDIAAILAALGEKAT